MDIPAILNLWHSLPPFQTRTTSTPNEHLLGLFGDKGTQSFISGEQDIFLGLIWGKKEHLCYDNKF